MKAFAEAGECGREENCNTGHGKKGGLGWREVLEFLAELSTV